MKRKTAAAVISILGAAVIVLGVVSVVHVRRTRELEYAVRANAQRSFSELVSDVGELSTDLQKCLYVSDSALQSALCTQVYGKALAAQMALASLPYESQTLEQAAGFIARVGDYACVLSRTVGTQGGYAGQELENLKSLLETAGVLADNLRELQLQLDNGTMTMDTALLPAAEEESITLSDSIADIESEFPEIPTLIYDGPFSDGIVSGDPKLLQGAQQVDEATARAAAARGLGVSEEALQSAGESGGDVPCYLFTAQVAGGPYTVSVTKCGGELWSVLSAHSVETQRYSVQDGLKLAQDVMDALGVEGMEMSYHIVQNGVLTVNFEYKQENVTCYADLIKIAIALDNGTLQAYDASGYVSSHCERALAAAEVDEETARASLSEALEVQQSALALIPKDGGEEVLCHEFLCSDADGQRCLIYVNVLTGAQERILLLLEDEAGTLTI